MNIKKGGNWRDSWTRCSSPARRTLSGVDYTACKTTSSSMLQFQPSAGFFHCPTSKQTLTKRRQALKHHEISNS